MKKFNLNKKNFYVKKPFIDFKSFIQMIYILFRLSNIIQIE